MRHQLSITINGQPRDEVVLATPQPIADVRGLAVVFEAVRYPGDRFRLLRVAADQDDFSEGAYHFRRWQWWPQFTAGLYRARAVTLSYADGNTVEVPLRDEIVVQAHELSTTAVPVFTAL
jgi:hypothetical protein